MSSDHPGRWLVQQAKTAVTEFPENTGWLLRKLWPTPPPVERAVGEAREGAWRLTESIADAVPFGADSLDLRLHRAQEALEDAQRSERRALERLREADELESRATTVAAEGRRRVQETKAAGERRDEASRRGGPAQGRRDGRRGAEAAEADQRRAVEETEARNEAEREEAERTAAEARERANAEMADAQEQLAQARQLADEAAEAAHHAAEEAHRRARAMTEQADAQSQAAEARAAEADQARGSVGDETAEFVRRTEEAPAADDLPERTKAELLDLAASLDLDGRSAMTKDQLVKAIRRASGNRRAASARS